MDLSHKISEARSVAIFVIVDLQPIVYTPTYLVIMFIVYIHTKFHIHISNGILVITTKLKAK